MPEIFIERKKNYSNYDGTTFPAKIILEKNFRSNSEIIDAVNFIFSKLMSEDIGGIDYNNEEKMVAQNKKTSNNKSFEVQILNSEENSEKKSPDLLEAEHIADLIKQDVSEGKSEYKDFCILLRSTKNHIEVFRQVFEQFSIPTWTDISENFFDSVEITTLMSLLEVIDNPIQDIPLMATMTCPIFDFSLDELANMRSKDKKSCLFEIIQNMANNGDLHCVYFIKKLNEYRTLASNVSITHLLDFIYYNLGLLAIFNVCENGNRKLTNLKKFLNYASDYEKLSDTPSFSGFLRLMKNLKNKKVNVRSNEDSLNNINAVKIMSIHASKGLEFPICILANCFRKFHKDHEGLLMHKKLGIGMRIRDAEKLYQYTTLQREAISLQINDEETAEELRILYDALTRAKEKLILINTMKDSLNSKGQNLYINSERSLRYIIKHCQTISDWIMLCDMPNISVNLKEKENIKKDENSNNTELKGIINRELFLQLSKRFNYVYRRKDLFGVPSKISVSELSKNSNETYEITSKPMFLNNQRTPTDRGNAVHYFLQIADFKKAARNLESYLNELKNMNKISETEIKMLNKQKISIFLHSDLVKRILKSENILREYKFTVDIEASYIKNNIKKSHKDETVLLQGCVDCAFLENDEIVIVDYKTDKTKSEEDLRKMYSEQLNLYKYALEKCTGKKVKECIIYSFSLEKSIPHVIIT
jgi:ATP-dependent helicase/nuclease subunit A